MALITSATCSFKDFMEGQQKMVGGPGDPPFACREAPSDSCRWSTSNSTATPSEVASSHGQGSPRHVESSEELDAAGPVERCPGFKSSQSDTRVESLSGWVRPELDDAPLGDMFADSDGEAGPISPSKSARRRIRRRRQRDAIRAAAQQEEESDRKDHGAVTSDEIIAEHGDGSVKVVATPQNILVTTPMHKTSRNPDVLSTNPRFDSPASGVSSSICGASPLVDASNRHVPSVSPSFNLPDASSRHLLPVTPPTSFPDASSRHLPPMTPPSNLFGQPCCNASPCASNRGGLASASILPTAISPTAMISANVTAPQVLPITSSLGSPCTRPVAAPSLRSVPGRIEQWSISPGGQSGSDTLRMLLGTSVMPSGEDIVAKLQAAAPDVYED